MRQTMAAALAIFPACVRAVCEPWCSESCTALNGNVQLECDSCATDGSHGCFPGAVGWDTWEARAQRWQIDANGNALPQKTSNGDGVVERTEKSLVYEAPYYEIAQRSREPGGEAERIASQWPPLPVPQHSPRVCEVHHCVLVPGDEACADGIGVCDEPKGHLRPIGEQYERMEPAMEHDARAAPLSARGFWERALSKVRPLVMRGAAAAVANASDWSDEALLEACTFADGRPWSVLVEKQNRITSNDRHPLMPGWDFCHFLRSYSQPEYTNMLYSINSIAVSGLRLTERLALPSSLECEELYSALYDARLWMSGGNTTSSLHFDTHENMLLQLDGAKEIWMWHPNATAALYMDHHDKFGLSPINVDRVDLQRFPRMVDAPPVHARLEAGDALYIPDGYWHVIHSVPGERNVAIALEIAPYAGEAGVWPEEVRRMRDAPGLYWAEQVRISAAMREQLAERIPSRTSHRRPIACDAPLESPPRSLAECPWLGEHPRY